MTIHNILAIPDLVLRRKAHKVEKIDADVRTLVADMVETMRNAPGAGLAAPQVGISKRVIVVEYGKEDDEEAPKKLYVVINPEISFPTEEKVNGIEGCLSVPGYVGEVDRYTQAVVKGLNKMGKPLKIQAKGWLARIFQHEIDHIDGIVYTDRATRIWKAQKEEEQKIESLT
jgi:peptide deformylase